MYIVTVSKPYISLYQPHNRIELFGKLRIIIVWEEQRSSHIFNNDSIQDILAGSSGRDIVMDCARIGPPLPYRGN